MSLRLTLFPSSGVPRRLLLRDTDPPHRVGRWEQCEIWVDDVHLSREHARFCWSNGAWFLEDMGSTNGVVVNGLQIERALIDEFCEIRLASSLVVHAEPADSSAFEEEERRRVTEFRSHLTQTQFADTRSLPELLERMLESCCQVSGASRGLVMLGQRPEDLEVVARSGISEEELEAAGFSGSLGAVRQAIENRRPVVSADASTDTGLARRHSVAAGGIRCLACLPMLFENEVVGVLYLDSQKPGKLFDELDIEFLESLANHAVLALEVHRLREELRHVRQQAVSAPSSAVDETLSVER